MIHELKTWPEFFDAVKRGEKTFEVRRNDRGFQVGDTLRLVRYQPDPSTPSGGFETDERGGRIYFVGQPPRAQIDVVVTYKMDGGRFGLAADWCVLGFRLVPVTAAPRSWWEVFGIERIEASKMHQSTPHWCRQRIQAMADLANSRGVHPTEVERAVREALAELVDDRSGRTGGGS